MPVYIKHVSFPIPFDSRNDLPAPVITFRESLVHRQTKQMRDPWGALHMLRHLFTFPTACGFVPQAS